MTTPLVFEQSSLARNGQLEEFVHLFCEVGVLIFTLYIKLPDLVMLYALIDYIIYGIKLLTKITDFRVSKIPQGTTVNGL